MDVPPRREREQAFPIVGIGASAGGFEAVSALLERLPPAPGCALIVVLHLDPDAESHLVELLAKRTPMPVHGIVDGMLIERDHVYAIVPDSSVTVDGGRLRVERPSRPRSQRHPVDDLFRSLGAQAKECAVAVVLSGTGSNGSAGLKDIKGNDGLAIAQEPSTAGFDGMPRNAINTGLVDRVLPIEGIASTIADLAQRVGTHASASDIEEENVQALFALLSSKTRGDFRGYKRPTLSRRIRRRMSLHRVEDVDEYLAVLRDDRDEVAALAEDLTIKVTGFFRDAETWKALGEAVVAPLVRAKDSGGSIRCWVTGCSTGEEAYTLAMLLAEHAADAGKRFDVKIFATDVSEKAIGQARAGIYPSGITSEVSSARLERFFEAREDAWQVKKEIRDLIVFAPQNILRDPPFSRLDIVTCRNMLIYFEPQTQQRVLGLLHFALVPDGALLVGSAESIGREGELFAPVDKKRRIYRRIGPTRHELLAIASGDSRATRLAQRAADQPSGRQHLQGIVRDALLPLAPPSVLLDQQLRVVYFHGDTGRYLVHRDGQPDLDVNSMARDGLPTPIRRALAKSERDKRPVSVTTRMPTETGDVSLEVIATPVERDGLGFVLLSFVEHALGGPGDASRGEQDESQTHASLENALRANQTELQKTVEEFEIANEELKASNEEIISMNEELQSTNEELETSKEELQSLNEELNTVNSQLQAKVEELEGATNDLSNLLKASDIATLFLDSRMRVKWFTPAITQLFNLIASDTGRPIGDFAQKFTDGSLVSEAQRVLETLVPIATEVRADSGRWYLRRTLPYRTADDRIDGAVVTFVDITERKEFEVRLRDAVDAAEAAVAEKDQFLAKLSHELRTPLQPAVLALAQLESHGELPPRLSQMLAMATRNLRTEVRLIDDLLDLARAGRGEIRLQRQTMDAREVLSDTVNLCREEIDAKRHVVEVDRSSAEPCWIEADPVRLQQVLWNLLRNAVKFTPDKGKIVLRCVQNEHETVLGVTDTGVGIQPQMRLRIFDAFEKGGVGSGMGLGLSIAKALVEAHGGRIELDGGGRGQGSTFGVHLPRQAGAAADTPGASDGASDRSRAGAAALGEPGGDEGALAGLHVLLVEDHVDSAESLMRLLRSAGCTVVHADTAASALTAAETHAFDVLISDLGLPDGHGCDLMRQLADRGLHNGIALSGFGTPADKQRTSEAGFREHLVKPIAFDELRAAIGRSLH